MSSEFTRVFVVSTTVTNVSMGGIGVGLIYYKWDPKPDMTPYEFALCHPILHGDDSLISLLPPNALRHFRTVDKPGEDNAYRLE